MSSRLLHPQPLSPFRVLHIFFALMVLPGLSLLALPRISWSGTEILQVELAQSVQDREPALPTTPSAHCEKDTGHDSLLPRVRISDQQVVFWNRVAASDNTLLRHSWHKKSEEGWKAMAHVNLPIQKSSAFRIWSTKELHPTFHRGEWMIVVAMADDPKHILCITRFIVE